MFSTVAHKRRNVDPCGGGHPPPTRQSPVVRNVSTATRLPGSSLSIASGMVSEIYGPSTDTPNMSPVRP